MFGLFKSRSIRSGWEFRVSGVFWRLLPHAGKYLIGEERDVSAKRVTFFCIDFESGVPRWESISLGETWWIGLEAVHGESVILHGYSSPDMPEHRKIFVIDLHTGKLLWQNDDLAFVAVEGESVFAKKSLSEDRSMVELSLRDGRILRERVDRIPSVSEPDSSSALYPQAVRSFAELPQPVQSLFDKRAIRQDAASGVECLEEGEHVIVSWYEPIGSPPSTVSWRQELAVIRSGGGAVRFSDTLSANTAYPVPDSFFVMSHRLCYVRERSQLRTLVLNS